MKLNISEFRSRLTELLRGKEMIEVTINGMVVARVEPVLSALSNKIINKIIDPAPRLVPKIIPATVKAVGGASKTTHSGNLTARGPETSKEYACGCKVGDSKLCPKHHRM